MSKKKKGKVVSLKPMQLSPEKYIKTQARLLPIFECVINNDWETSGLCNIIVARQHKTGNITAGIYLVDMFCQGVKDAQYDFNLFRDDYEDLKSRLFSWENCDYMLAHNIIFGSIAYAEDYGFKSHKDFETARFILEEDDEAVELIELDFGLNGKPHYVSGPYDDPVKISNAIATLTRIAGEGNFTFTDNSDMFDDVDDEDMDDEDMEDWDEDDFDETDDYRDTESHLKSMLKVLQGVSETYEAKIRTERAKQMLAEFLIGSQYELSETEGALEDNRFDNDEQRGEYYRLRTIIANTAVTPVISEFKEAVFKYPASPAFHNLLQTAYISNKMYDEAEQTITLMYKVFPDYFPSLINYAGMLLVNDEPESFWAVFKGKPDLNYLYPGRTVFHVGEALVYYACMCRYFTAINEIDSADAYMNAMLKYADTDFFKQTELVKFAVMDLFKAKLGALQAGGLL